ncbi:MAG: hypothetical protein ACYSSI_03820 [Planctomycetota bacterium]|jgi:hypothetical protein
MPLHVRSISASTAVVCFFTVSLIGWISGLSPFTCCKRALTAAFVVYVIAALAIKAINIILINAMINSQMNQQKENISDNQN